MRDGGYGKSVMMTVAVGDNGCLRQLQASRRIGYCNNQQVLVGGRMSVGPL
jgi:hypothetical protein